MILSRNNFTLGNILSLFMTANKYILGFILGATLQYTIDDYRGIPGYRRIPDYRRIDNYKRRDD